MTKRSILAALLALAASAAEGKLVPPPVPGAPAPAIELLAPRDGENWVSGEIAEVAWRTTDEGWLARIEEWEAFLSVDGGRSWPVRLTPHLDRGLGRYRFIVPNLPSEQARLLLRFGDERREVEVAPGAHFAIQAGFSPDLAVRYVFAAGEPAQRGGRAVLRWEEGSRRGAHTRTVETAAARGSCHSLPSFSEGGPGLAAEEGEHDGPAIAGLVPLGPRPDPEPRLAARSARDSSGFSRDSLAFLCRLNE